MTAWLDKSPEHEFLSELTNLRDDLLIACANDGDLESISAKILEAYRKATGQDLP